MLTGTDTPVDEAFWHARLGQAVALRRLLRLDEQTDAYRLVHAEGDDLSGLIVERYADTLVFEFFALGMYQRREQFRAAFADLLGPPTALDRAVPADAPWQVVYRADSRIEQMEGFRVAPVESQTAAERLIIREHGVRYRVDARGGHKTGFFCDQRDNRLALSRLCRDADVLDLCCYTGGFSLNAAINGGARSVVGVDLDESVVALAKQNANLNQTRVDFTHADVFIYVRQMLANGRQFDVVILDPPKLVLGRMEYEDGLRKYGDLNHLALQVVKPGGVLLTCSCSGLVSKEAHSAK